MNLNFVHLLLHDIDKPDYKMNSNKIPSFLNTEDKWNECVRNTDAIDKFENIFYKLLEDDDMYAVDILRIMKKLERYIVLVHESKDIYCVLDVVDLTLRYLITTAGAREKVKDKNSPTNYERHHSQSAQVEEKNSKKRSTLY